MYSPGQDISRGLCVASFHNLVTRLKATEDRFLWISMRDIESVFSLLNNPHPKAVKMAVLTRRDI